MFPTVRFALPPANQKSSPNTPPDCWSFCIRSLNTIPDVGSGLKPGLTADEAIPAVSSLATGLPKNVTSVSLNACPAPSFIIDMEGDLQFWTQNTLPLISGS